MTKELNFKFYLILIKFKKPYVANGYCIHYCILYTYCIIYCITILYTVLSRIQNVFTLLLELLSEVFS